MQTEYLHYKCIFSELIAYVNIQAISQQFNVILRRMQENLAQTYQAQNSNYHATIIDRNPFNLIKNDHKTSPVSHLNKQMMIMKVPVGKLQV